MQSGAIGSPWLNHAEFKSSTPFTNHPPYTPYMTTAPYIVPSSYAMLSTLPYLQSLAPLTSKYIELLKIQQIYSEWINTLKTAIIENDEEALQQLTLNYPNLLNYFSGLPLVFTAGTLQLDPAQYFENFHFSLTHKNNAILVHMLKYNSQIFGPYLNKIDFRSQVEVLVIIWKHTHKNFFEEYIGYIENADVLRKVNESIKLPEPLKPPLSHRIKILSQNQRPTNKISSESMTAHDTNLNSATLNNNEPSKETDAEQSLKSEKVSTNKKRYIPKSKATEETKTSNKKLKTPSNSYTKITQAMPKMGNKSLPTKSSKKIIIPYVPKAVVESKFNEFLKAMHEKNDIAYRQIWRDYPQIVKYIENLNNFKKELEILTLASQANKCAESLTLFILVYLKSVRNLQVLETYLNYEKRLNVQEALKKQIAWLKETTLTKTDDPQPIPTMDLPPFEQEMLDPLFDELPIKFNF